MERTARSVFLYFDKNATGKWKDHFFTRDQFSEIADFVAEHATDDIYWCPHGFSDERRQKTCAVLPSLLWADLDEVNPRDIDPKPTIAIESSPSRYVAIWKVDKTINEGINKRLTYAIGADRGGWDVTQVLRMPGSHNHKYAKEPEVKVLWDAGPAHNLSVLARKLPPEPTHDDTSARFRAKMPPWLRRALTSDSPHRGKRSDMLWKMGHELRKIGCSRDEAFELLWKSPWNKFKGRAHQLRRDIDKIFNSQPNTPNDRSTRFAAKSLAEVEHRILDWIWFPYLARRELSILEGDPGEGKSYLAQVVSAALCDGAELPSPRPTRREPLKVIYFDVENDAETVTKGRLKEIERPENFFPEEAAFSIGHPSSLDAVGEAIERIGPALVVFDTINTYIGDTDTDNAARTTQGMAPFRELARRYNCAVLVLRHLTKSTKEKAIYRGQGSIAFAGVARVVMTCGRVPDDLDTRVMAVTKLNITRMPKALTYRIKAKPTMKDPDGSEFIWGEYVDLTSEQIIFAPTEQHSELSDAIAFLEQTLTHQSMEKNALMRAAEGRGFSSTTIKRAAEHLGVKFNVTGFGKAKRSIWEL